MERGATMNMNANKSTGLRPGKPSSERRVGIRYVVAAAVLAAALLIGMVPATAFAQTLGETNPSAAGTLGASDSECSLFDIFTSLFNILDPGNLSSEEDGPSAPGITYIPAADANDASHKSNPDKDSTKAGVVGTYTVNGTDYALVRGFYVHDDESYLDVFYYSDGLFYSDPYRYNEHLGSLSWAFAMAGGYLDQDKTMRDADTCYNKHAAGRQFLADIGCSDQVIYVNDFNLRKPTTESIGVTIGSKMLTDADGNETGDILVPVVVRGSGYGLEWVSNVTLGTAAEMSDRGMEAKGFANAADEVFAEVEKYLSNYGLQEAFEAGHVKFWVAGYSRAGATANLTGKRLIDKIERECQSGSKSQVICYTCEAPKGGTDVAEVAGNDYTCIHNMINAVDIVPLVAPAQMGFKRYGVDHYVPGTAAGEVKATVTKVTRSGEGGPTTVTTYSDNEITKTKTAAYSAQKTLMLQQLRCLDGETTYDDAFRPYALDFVSWSFPFDFKTMYIYANGDEADNRAEDFVLDFARILQEGLNPSETYGKGKVVATRDQYASHLYSLNGNTYPTVQQTIQDLMHAFWNMSAKERTAFVAAVKTIVDYIPTLAPMSSSDDQYPLGFDTLYLLIGEWDEESDLGKQSYINHLWEALGKTGALNYLTGEDRSNIERDFPTIVNLAFKFLDADYNYKPGKNSASSGWAKGSDESMMFAATFYSEASYILSCHNFVQNIAWVRSYDDWYKDEHNLYRVQKPESVEPTSAYGKVGNTWVGIVEGDGEINRLSGDQWIVLDNESIVGEAIYYDIYEVRSNGGSTQLVRNQLYRGGIKLEISWRAEHYIIKTYSISYGVTAETDTYHVKLHDSSHAVSVWDMPETGPYNMADEIGYSRAEERWAAGLPRDFREQTWTLEEGQDVTYTTHAPSDRAFKAWTVQVLDAEGNVVANDIADTLLGDAKTNPTIDCALPEPDAATFPAGYQLRFIATYYYQTDKVTVVFLLEPETGYLLCEHTNVRFGRDSHGVEYEPQWFDQYGNAVSGYAEADTVYTAIIRIDENAAEGLLFADEIDLELDVDNVTDATVTKNEDGGITIQLTFEKTASRDSFHEESVPEQEPVESVPEQEPVATVPEQDSAVVVPEALG